MAFRNGCFSKTKERQTKDLCGPHTTKCSGKEGAQYSTGCRPNTCHDVWCKTGCLIWILANSVNTRITTSHYLHHSFLEILLQLPTLWRVKSCRQRVDVLKEQKLHCVLQKMQDEGLTLNEKFSMKHIILVGHKVSAAGFDPDPDKVKAILQDVRTIWPNLCHSCLPSLCHWKTYLEGKISGFGENLNRLLLRSWKIT